MQMVKQIEKNRIWVRNWLYLVCLLVFAMVIVGGATRLTDSGLSITEWKPLLGAIPPLNELQWQEAFDKYKLIPEYKQINKHMNLEEFKFIYFWEWGHRLLGRLIGIVVFIPMVWFFAKGMIDKKTAPRLIVMFLLGALQGFIGWWMVKSGLSERVDVSQYRLAAHLTLAVIIFAIAMWQARALTPHSDEPYSEQMAFFAPVIVFAIIIQIFLGALVAGLDAGLAFNDWPTMDGAIIPTNLFVQDPAYLNFFENPKMVQFTHRMFAYFTVLLIFVHMVWSQFSDVGTTHARRTIILMLLALLQTAIGITTLVLQVPLMWALLHQGGAIILLSFAIMHWRGLKGEYPV